jgi:hypothetical protein
MQVSESLAHKSLKTLFAKDFCELRNAKILCTQFSSMLLFFAALILRNTMVDGKASHQWN